MYLKDHDDRLGNHPIRLVTVDEGETPETAKAAVEQLLKDKVRILAGISNPQALAAVKDTVEAGQVPLVTPSPSLAALQTANYIWRTGFITDEPGRALGRWVANNADGPVFILAEEAPGVLDDVRGFVEELTAARGTVYRQPVYSTPGTKDFSTRLGELQEPAVGALFCLYTGSAAVEAVKQLKAAELPRTLKIFGPGLLTEGEQLTQQGDAATGIYTAMNYSSDLSTLSNRRFVSDYQKAFHVAPSSLAVSAYDMGTVLDQSLALAEDDDTALGINNAISQLGQIDSPRGPWQFNQNRSPLQKWFLRQVKADGPVLANVLTAELVTLG